MFAGLDGIADGFLWGPEKIQMWRKKAKKKGICLVNSRSVSVGPLLQQRPGPKTIEKRDTFIFVNSQIAGLFTRSKMATKFVPLDGICNLMPCLPTNTLPWQRWWGGNNIPRAQQRSGTLALLYDSTWGIKCGFYSSWPETTKVTFQYTCGMLQALLKHVNRNCWTLANVQNQSKLEPYPFLLKGCL